MDDKNEQWKEEAERLTQTVKTQEQPAESSGGSGIMSGILRGIGKYVLFVVIGLLMIFVVKPLVYNGMDMISAQTMTDEEKQEAMGLPLKVSKPPKQADHQMTREELRWSEMMELKLKVMKKQINPRNREAVHEYNAMVDDFNARCASYRYKESEKLAVQNDMEKYRADITQKTKEEVQAKGWDKAGKDAD